MQCLGEAYRNENIKIEEGRFTVDVLMQQIVPPQPASRVWLRGGQWITIGASERADFRLPGEAELPPLCARLEVRESDCLITDISPARPVLSVNDTPTAMTVLASGDTIQIGQTILQVQWEMIQAPTDVPVTFRDFREEQTPSGVSKWSPTAESTWPMADVVGQLYRSRSPMLMANGRAGGRQAPRWLLEQEDHFAQAPEEIRREHSLQIVSDLPLRDVWEIYSPLHATDAAIWALPDGPTVQTVADAKLYLAWFARPSILELNLQHGSPFFLEGLFKPFAGFCFRPSGGRDWVVYGRPGLTRDSFGFQRPM